MVPQYLTDDKKPAKMFREDFYATAAMFEVGVTELLKTMKADDISLKDIKEKMHELLFNKGMSAFTGKEGSADAKKFFKANYPEFYQPMQAVAETPAPKKEEKKSLVKKPDPKAPAKSTGTAPVRSAMPKQEA